MEHQFTLPLMLEVRQDDGDPVFILSRHILEREPDLLERVVSFVSAPIRWRFSATSASSTSAWTAQHGKPWCVG